MEFKSMSDLDAFMIGKELGKFCVKQDKSAPSIDLSLDNIEEKASKVASKGFNLTAFQTALFTFLHEYEHYRQYKDNEVTAAEINDTNFPNTEKAKKLEKEADVAAVNFIKGHRLSFDAFSLQILSNEVPNIPKIGEQVELQNDVELIDTVYFEHESKGFYCGQNIPTEAVDIGQYKITLKKGFVATINSISGSNINLIDLSGYGVISAYDSIKGKELSNQVIVASCSVDFKNLKRVS
jgi:hypothetical protein